MAAMNLKRIQKHLLFYAANLLLVLLVWGVSQTPFLQTLNFILVDNLHGQVLPRDEIVIVKIDDDSLAQIGSWPWERSVFGKALKNINSQGPAVVAFDILFLEERMGDEQFQAEINTSNASTILGSKLIGETECFSNDCTGIIKSVFHNTEEGFVNFDADSDGKIRRSKLWSKNNGVCTLSFSLMIYATYTHTGTDELCTNNLQIRKDSYTLDEDNQLIFSYTKKDFKSISIHDVTEGRYGENFFKDKIILVGSTAIDLRSNLNDNFTNIFGESSPGIVIHANIVNSFLDNRFYTNINPLLELLGVIGISNLMILIIRRIRNYIARPITLTIILIIVNLVGIILFEEKVIAPFIFINIALFSSYSFLVAYNYFVENKENRFIKKAFEYYISPKLLNKILASPKELGLGGETRQMSVLFSDIRSFTSISEQLAPQQLVAFLNKYLDFMSDVIISHDGTIDKFIGDAIMCFWNAPTYDPLHALHSLMTAMYMKKSTQDFQQQYPNFPRPQIGIGITTGEMVVGNIGGSKKFDYTVLGDNVNLASRLESLTKKYQVTILMSERTMLEATNFGKNEIGNTLFREIDEVVVKGRNASIKIFEPLDNTETNLKLIDAYTKAFQNYQKGNFRKAKDLFLKLSEKDKPSRLLYERIIRLGNNPPADWNGVWFWEEK